MRVQYLCMITVQAIRVNLSMELSLCEQRTGAGEHLSSPRSSHRTRYEHSTAVAVRGRSLLGQLKRLTRGRVGACVERRACVWQTGKGLHMVYSK